MPVDHDVVTVELFFEAPFFECLRREAERNHEGDVDGMLKRWVWCMHGRQLRGRYSGLTVDVEAEIPDDLYETAELMARMEDSEPTEQDIERFLFDYISWNHTFTRADEE